MEAMSDFPPKFLVYFVRRNTKDNFWNFGWNFRDFEMEFLCSPKHGRWRQVLTVVRVAPLRRLGSVATVPLLAGGTVAVTGALLSVATALAVTSLCPS